MAITKDIQHVIRDFIGVNGGGVRLEEGETYGEFLRRKKYGKTFGQETVGEINQEVKRDESEEKKDVSN